MTTGEIDLARLPVALQRELFDRTEREHPTASDAEKWRLLEAAALLYLCGYRPLPTGWGALCDEDAWGSEDDGAWPSPLPSREGTRGDASSS